MPIMYGLFQSMWSKSATHNDSSNYSHRSSAGLIQELFVTYIASEADCQTIVISLKAHFVSMRGNKLRLEWGREPKLSLAAALQDRFFVRADALVGVWKNKPQVGSLEQ